MLKERQNNLVMTIGAQSIILEGQYLNYHNMNIYSMEIQSIFLNNGLLQQNMMVSTRLYRKGKVGVHK